MLESQARVYRVYCQMKLNLPRRTKKRLPIRLRQPLVVAARPNQIWSLDFMADCPDSGRRFRILMCSNEGVRETLAIEIDPSLTAKRVIRILNELKSWRGLPLAIRLDNGPELIADAFVAWSQANAVELRYIQPGKPNQNAFIERFNRTYRNEVLDAYLFDDLDEVREISDVWLHTYNEQRPHDSLRSLLPALFRARLKPERISTFKLST